MTAGAHTDRDQPGEMSFLDHLEELRWRIVRVLIGIVLGAILCGVFIDEIVTGVLLRPVLEVNAALPAGHPPIAGMGEKPVMPELPAASKPAVNLTYAPPDTWQKEPVKSGLRYDQYRLPRIEGDAEDGELVDEGGHLSGRYVRCGKPGPAPAEDVGHRLP